MKKIVILSSLFFLIGIEAFGQDQVTVKAGEDINTLLISNYLFPEFMNARVLLKNETVVAKMNYNALSGQMEYIDPSGEVLVLKNNAQAIVFPGRFFKQTSKGYLEIIADGIGFELLIHRKYRQGDIKKMGAYGTVSSTTAIDTQSFISTDLGVTSLTLAQEVTYIKTSTYFIYASGKYLLASKATFSKVFGKQKPGLEEYLKKSPVDFSSEDDLLRLFRYCTE